jgi:hypothetical protein
VKHPTPAPSHHVSQIQFACRPTKRQPSLSTACGSAAHSSRQSTHPTPAVLSSDPDTIRIPSLENTTELTVSAWPFSTFSSAPVDASQTRMVLSPEPDTIRMPFLENATELTQSVWHCSTFISAPVDASHTRTVVSCEPDTILMPSLGNATELTE